MGTDIHLHVEVKMDNQWKHYAQLSPDRNYLAFTKMAGVRGDREKAIALPKGIPPDATEMTMIDAEYVRNGHSHSWLSSHEIDLLYEWWASRWGYPNNIEQWIGAYFYCNAFSYRPDFIQDVRFIFWFDD